MNQKPLPIIFDCDPGIDDAVALLMAMASPAIQLLGISTVVGNTSLSKIQRNARYLCELAGRADVPVFAGCPRPLMSWTHYDDPRTSEAFSYVAHIHGATGLGNHPLTEPHHPLQLVHAVSFLIETLSKVSEKITLLATGPLTNIAAALIQAPEIRRNLERIILMGGVRGVGNITPSAEHNFFVDPHAASIVFDAGVPVVMSGLDLTRQVPVTPELMERLRSQKTQVSQALVEIIESRPSNHFEPGMTVSVLHDPTVVVYLLRPDLFKGREAYVSIDTNAGASMGRSNVYFSSSEPSNAFVLEEVNLEGFYDVMLDLLSSYQKKESF